MDKSDHIYLNHLLPVLIMSSLLFSVLFLSGGWSHFLTPQSCKHSVQRFLFRKYVSAHHKLLIGWQLFQLVCRYNTAESHVSSVGVKPAQVFIAEILLASLLRDHPHVDELHMQRISPDQHITSSLAVNPTVNTRNITCLLPNFCDLWSGVRPSASCL